MSAKLTLRAYQSADLDSVLRINEESVHFLAPMDEARLQLMMAWSARVRIADYNGAVAGFLITFEDGSDYDSLNYRWFAEHLKRFVYIDRIVIDQSYRGKGIGQQIYSLLANPTPAPAPAADRDTSSAAGSQPLWLAAEIDIEPRNDNSLAFHQLQGFVEVATQSAGQGKQVSLQIKSI